MTKLSQLLQAANRESPLTLRERAKQIGGALDFTTIGRYQSGNHPQHPDEKTLRLLAAAYHLRYAEVQRAAGVRVGAGPYIPPDEAARLTKRQQNAIDELIRAFTSDKE